MKSEGSLYASSTLCYKQLGKRWGTSKHNCLVSYLLGRRRHVSATVGHLQVTKMYIEENYTEYDHSIGVYLISLSVRLYRVAQKERMFFKWVVVGRVSFFGVTSNQKSTFENLVQSTI